MIIAADKFMHLKVLFICWSYIKELLHDDVIISIENSGLMEFDF